MEKLMPPLVAQLRRKVRDFRDSGYVGARDTSKSLLNWWLKEPHLLPRADGATFDLKKGSALSLQVDVTATPKHNNGAIFVQTVSDYPLVEAISQNVVKPPVLPDAASRARLTEKQSAKYTEKYADYLDLGVIEWRKAYEEHQKLGKGASGFSVG